MYFLLKKALVQKLDHVVSLLQEAQSVLLYPDETRMFPKIYNRMV